MIEDCESAPQPALPPLQATAARIVLDDCRQLLHELQENPQGQRWRVRWAAVVVLLRSVGYVLKSVDANPKLAAPEFKEAADEWWAAMKKSEPNPPLFWRFIEEQRNAIVHEYEFTAEQGLELPGDDGPVGPVVVMAAPRGMREGIPRIPLVPTYRVVDGPFAGRDQRDLVAEAIAWWEEQLGEIALRAGAKALAKALPPDL